MDDYDFYEVEPQGPRHPRFRLFLYLAVVMLLIVGLSWSAISGVVWFWERAREETAVITPIAPETSLAADLFTLSTPDPAHAVNRIVFVNPDGQIETIAPDGSDRRQISEGAVRFQFPTWSPTGEYVAAIGGSAVYRLVDSVVTDQEELYASRRASPFYLYWSPDGRYLSFLANHAQGISLNLVGVSGESESRLLQVGSPLYWDWTADSSQILMHTGFAGEDARLALFDINAGRSGPNVAAPGLFQAPDISGNGRYWAFAELDENGSSWLVAADSQTGAVQRQRHAGLVALGWSPAADQLAFISTGAERMNFTGPLRLMDAATGEVRLISREPVAAFFWSPDGRYLATITSIEGLEGDIARGNGRRHVSKSTRQQHPDILLNLALIDVATGEKNHLTTFQPTLTFITQFLPFFDQYALSHRLWSPDSRALVLPVQEDGGEYVKVIPIDGSPPQQLAEGDMPFWSQQ